MTTPDQQYETVEPTDRSGSSTTEVLESSEAPDTSAVATESSTIPADSSTAESLCPEKELSGLRSRWTQIQSGFVDDPREWVQKADSLVSDVVDQLTAGFAEARSRLEAQWARGEEISTEDLRLAMKRYREFFQRLLSF
jgi:hypothetical protein